MNKPINLLVGGLTMFVAQGCKAPKQASQQAEHPNIIYVFPDQYRNQAMGFWSQDGFRDKVNFEGDPVHTPNLDAFARESMVLSSAQSNCPLSSPHRGMLLTGMYPNKSGVPLNCNSTRPISIRQKQTSPNSADVEKFSGRINMQKILTMMSIVLNVSGCTPPGTCFFAKMNDTVMTTAILANSDGCNGIQQIDSQRCAPFTSSPKNIA